MQISDFIEATSRLEKYFDKTYTTEQSKIMYEEMKELSIERYKMIVAQCIRNCKYLPKIAEILAINSEIRIQKNNENIEEESCNICGSKGFILYTKLDKANNYNYQYVCRCKCKNANNFLSFPLAIQVGI